MPYADPEHDRERKRRWKRDNLDKCNNAARRRYARLSKAPDFYIKRRIKARKWGAIARPRRKRETIDHYGGKCGCCNERRLPFLTIDHPNNDGAAHRKSLKMSGAASGWRIYDWLRSQGYPKGFRVLCWNCNVGRHINGGKCPHKDKKWR